MERNFIRIENNLKYFFKEGYIWSSFNETVFFTASLDLFSSGPACFCPVILLRSVFVFFSTYFLIFWIFFFTHFFIFWIWLDGLKLGFNQYLSGEDENSFHPCIGWFKISFHKVCLNLWSLHLQLSCNVLLNLHKNKLLL